MEALKFNKTYSGRNLASLELATNDDGLIRFWHFCRNIMLDRKNAAVVFKPNFKAGLGGMEVEYSNCNFVVLPMDFLESGVVTFKDDEAAAVFIHELCHYLHFANNCGRYLAPHQKHGQVAGDYNRNITERFLIELEAWFLSRNYKQWFKIKNEAIDSTNVKNMINTYVL